jgi:hypothetical protein
MVVASTGVEMDGQRLKRLCSSAEILIARLFKLKAITVLSLILCIIICTQFLHTLQKTLWRASSNLQALESTENQ